MKRGLENLIERLIKERIKELDLIDTEALYNSISVSISDSQNDFKIDISSVDYLEYLDERYDIIDFVLSKPEVTDAIAEYVFDTLEDL